MGNFEWLLEPASKKDALGNTVVFPGGTFGSGYVVHSEEIHQAFRKRYKSAMILVVAFVLIILPLTNYWVWGACLVVFEVCDYLSLKTLTRGLPKSTEKYSYSESMRDSAKSMHLAIAVVLGFGSLVFVVAGVWALFCVEEPLMALAAILFFGFCSAAYGYIIFLKFRQRNAG